MSDPPSHQQNTLSIDLGSTTLTKNNVSDQHITSVALAKNNPYQEIYISLLFSVVVFYPQVA